MHGKPYGFAPGCRPFDPVAHMGGNFEVIAGFKDNNIVFILNPKTRPAFDHQNKFIIILIIPEAVRGGMPPGHDAFNQDMVRLAYCIKAFLRQFSRYIRE
jgi:hypothetical protein